MIPTNLIDGIPIEIWLGGTTNTSKCCGACGDSECRTINIAGRSYEAIPEHLIIRAGLLAAAEKYKTAQLLDDFR